MRAKPSPSLVAVLGLLLLPLQAQAIGFGAGVGYCIAIVCPRVGYRNLPSGTGESIPGASIDLGVLVQLGF